MNTTYAPAENIPTGFAFLTAEGTAVTLGIGRRRVEFGIARPYTDYRCRVYAAGKRSRIAVYALRDGTRVLFAS